MNKKINIVKNKLLKQKKLYMFLSILLILGLIISIIFYNSLSIESKEVLLNNINEYFINLNKININQFINLLLKNIIYLLIIWLLGYSVFGSIFTIPLLVFKSFVIGLSAVSILSLYKIKGIIAVLIYVFPHQIINLIVYLLVSFYSIMLSKKLFSVLFLKQNIRFNIIIKKYIFILFFSLLILVLTSFYEIYISKFLMKIFTSLIK